MFSGVAFLEEEKQRRCVRCPHTQTHAYMRPSAKKKNTELWKSGRTHAAPARIGPQASLHILLKGAGQTSESANSLQVDQKQKVRRMMKKIGG